MRPRVAFQGGRSVRFMFSHILQSVPARPPPEEPAEEPPEGLQPDGAAGGQRLAAPDGGLHAQLDPDHGRGQSVRRHASSL